MRGLAVTTNNVYMTSTHLPTTEKDFSF